MLKKCAITMLIVGVISLVLCPIALFTAGVGAGVYFGVLGVCTLTVGRWWLR